MRDAKYRQLIAPLLAAIAVWPVCSNAEPASPLPQRVQALQLRAAITPDDDVTERTRLVAAYDELVAQHPKEAAAYSARGDFRWGRGERVGAVADWERALQLDARDGEALGGLAGAALERGDVLRATDLQRQSVAAVPESAAAHFALGNMLFLFRHQLSDSAHLSEAEVFRQALAEFTEAARLAPQNVEYARGLAETYYSVPNPNWEHARTAWERVRDLSPAKDFARVNLARVELRLGHRDAARQHLDQVQAPTFQRIKARLTQQIEDPPPASPVDGGGSRLEPKANSSKPAIDGPSTAP